MSFINKLFEKKQKISPQTPGHVQTHEKGRNNAQDIFRIGLRHIETSPLNNKVWHFILIVIGACAAAVAVRIVLGRESLFAVWLITLLSLFAWFFAIRLLLLDSRLKNSGWSGWQGDSC